MFNMINNICSCIIFKSNKFKFVLEFRFFINFSFYNSDNNRVLISKNRFLCDGGVNDNGFTTNSVHNVGIRIADLSFQMFRKPLRSKFYVITYSSFFNNFSYKVGFLIRDEPLSTTLLNYLVYILNLRFNLTGRYFYTGVFHSSYLQEYKFFTLRASPSYIKIYSVTKENYEVYVNILNYGGLYVLDYEVYPSVIFKKLIFSFPPMSYREVPLKNRLTMSYYESFVSLELEIALASDYDNKFFRYLAGFLNFNHLDLTHEAYNSCPNRSNFFSTYYKDSLEKGLTIESVVKDINNNPKPLKSSIFYLIKVLNMRFNVSGRYFYYEGLPLNRHDSKFYSHGSQGYVHSMLTYELNNSNLKDFLIVLKYGTKKLDVEREFCLKHSIKYSGPIKPRVIPGPNLISNNFLEYYFHYKLENFMDNQFKPNMYKERLKLAPYNPQVLDKLDETTCK